MAVAEKDSILTRSQAAVCPRERGLEPEALGLEVLEALEVLGLEVLEALEVLEPEVELPRPEVEAVLAPLVKF